MDLSQLRAFVAVAEDLHFGRAAERLHFAQPYLSRTIRALEEDLGAPLFRRTTRRVELTPAGSALAERARRMLALGEEARGAVIAAHQGRSGRVRIGFAGPSSHVAVGQLARAVREQHPAIDLEFMPGWYGTTAAAEVLRHNVDLAIARFAEPPDGVACRSVARERCVMAVPVGHRLAAGGKVRFDDLRDEPFVAFPESFGSDVRRVLVQQCQSRGFMPVIAQSAPDSWTSVALVSAGVGMHLTTTGAVAQLPLDGIRICEIVDDVPPILVYLMWRRNDEDRALHRVLRTSAAVLPDVV